MALRITLLVIVGLLNIALALIVMARDHRKLINGAFFIMALSAAAWGIGIAGFLLASSTSSALQWAKFYYAAPIILVATAVVVSDIFPEGGRPNVRKFVAILFGALVVLLPLLVVPNFVITGIRYHDWGKEIVLDKRDYLIYSAYIVVGFWLMLGRVAKKAKTEHGLNRLQAQIFLYGTMGSAFFGTLFNLFLPWFGNYRLVWVGPLATSIYLLTTLYSIIKHKLFDIRLIIARSVGYILSILALGMLYGVAAFMIVTWLLGGHVASVSERAVSAALAVVLALAFRPIKRFFDRVTNNLFYRDAYDTQAFIDRLNHLLVASIELQDLLEDTARLIQETLKAQYCAFVLVGKGKGRPQFFGETPRQLDEHSLGMLTRAIIPNEDAKILVTDNLDGAHEKRFYGALQSANIAMFGRIEAGPGQSNEEVGYMMLGAKKSGNPYNGQDVKTMEVVVNELAIAIQNALRFRQIENFNLTLQEKIDDATRKLRRANDKLRKLNDTKDDFISMASHQLRTPLTSVKGYVSMVLDGDAGKITRLQRKLLNQSFISSQRMVYLISDLLNVSRLKTGKFIIEPVKCNLAKVIQEEVEQLVQTAKGRRLELTYNRPEHFPILLLDETKMRQVIMNFLDNAVYYTPAGGHITVSLVDKPQSIEFTVTDDGIGVPRHEQHHLFTKFYRAPNAKRARPDGTGLGLFMAKKVVVAQGGAVIFKSQENKGSTFGFTFAKAPLLTPESEEKSLHKSIDADHTV